MPQIRRFSVVAVAILLLIMGSSRLATAQEDAVQTELIRVLRAQATLLERVAARQVKPELNCPFGRRPPGDPWRNFPGLQCLPDPSEMIETDAQADKARTNVWRSWPGTTSK